MVAERLSIHGRFRLRRGTQFVDFIETLVMESWAGYLLKFAERLLIHGRFRSRGGAVWRVARTYS